MLKPNREILKRKAFPLPLLNNKNTCAKAQQETPRAKAQLRHKNCASPMRNQKHLTVQAQQNYSLSPPRQQKKLQKPNRKPRQPNSDKKTAQARRGTKQLLAPRAQQKHLPAAAQTKNCESQTNNLHELNRSTPPPPLKQKTAKAKQQIVQAQQSQTKNQPRELNKTFPVATAQTKKCENSTGNPKS
jgi:hypothetical protein